MPRYLKWSATTALIMLTLFLVAATKNINNRTVSDNIISFTGEGKVFAVPDVAAVSFSIVTEATTSKQAQDENSNKSEEVVNFLKSQDIDDKDIKTTGYNIYPQYSYPRPVPLGAPEGIGTNGSAYYNSNPKITGYQVNQSFKVKVRDLEKISAILDGLVAQGANQVNHLGFQIDNEEELKDQAREMAIKNAKEKADTIRKQIGIKLGKIINYYEGGNYPMYDMAYLEARPQSGGIGGGGPSVPAGENEVIVNVTLTYQIK